MKRMSHAPKSSRKTSKLLQLAELETPAAKQPTAASFYSDQFTDPERDLVDAFVADPRLDDEIWMQRVLNRRLLVHANLKDEDGASPSTQVLIKLAEALTIGTGRVARMLRDKRVLSGEAAGSLAEAADELLAEIRDHS
jgi:hypothetical protein